MIFDFDLIWKGGFDSTIIIGLVLRNLSFA